MRAVHEQSRKLLLFTVVMLAFLSLSPHIFTTGLAYDSGLYAALGYSIYKENAYQFNEEPGDVPPAYPIVLAIFMAVFGENGIYLASPLMSIILTVTIYLLLEREFSQTFAFLGALLFFSTRAIFTYSIYVLTDITMLALVMLCYLVYNTAISEVDDKKITRWILLGALAALSILTKYASVAYLLPLFIHAAYRREKFALTSAATALILMLPWSVWSQANHGTLLVIHALDQLYKIQLGAGMFRTEGFSYFKSWFFYPVLVLSLLGGMASIYKKRIYSLVDVYLLLFVFTFLSASVWPVQAERYLLAAVFPAIYFCLHLLSKVNKKKLVSAFLIYAIALQLPSAYTYVGFVKQKGVLLKDSGHWLRENTPEGTVIAAQSYRQINFFAHRRTFQMPTAESDAESFIKENNVSYILIDSYEATPLYLYTFAERYKLEKEFNDKTGYVRIYRTR